MPMVKVTVFTCPHCHRTIPHGLNRDDYGSVTCPGCSLPVRITSSEYEDSRQKNVFYICWTIAAVAIFLIVTISTYAEKHKFWDAVGFAVLASAILTYVAGGLLGIIVVKLFPREFKK